MKKHLIKLIAMLVAVLNGCGVFTISKTADGYSVSFEKKDGQAQVQDLPIDPAKDVKSKEESK